MRRDIYWVQFRRLNQEKKMNKADFTELMVDEFQLANKEAMIKIGMTEEEAEEKNAEFYPSISFLLGQVAEKIFEKDIVLEK